MVISITSIEIFMRRPLNIS